MRVTKKTVGIVSSNLLSIYARKLFSPNHLLNVLPLTVQVTPNNLSQVLSLECRKKAGNINPVTIPILLILKLIKTFLWLHLAW